MKHKIPLFTTSWDDGHPFDVRVADLLDRYQMRGTFYVPITNMEGLPVLSATQLRSLANEFEVGSHTLDHCYLDSVNLTEARRQIVEGKTELEQMIGTPVRGFCYPGGRKNDSIIDLVKMAGFAYARGLSNLDTEAGERFCMPTTIQFYPHPRRVFLQNYLTKGSLTRYQLLPLLLRHGDLRSQLISSMEYVALNGGIFHLWGHSWELDKFDGWVLLNEVLAVADELFPPKARLTNLELVNQLYEPRDQDTLIYSGTD